MWETLLVIVIVFAAAVGVIWKSSQKIRSATRLCEGSSVEGKPAPVHNCAECTTPCPLKEIRLAARAKKKSASPSPAPQEPSVPPKKG